MVIFPLAPDQTIAQMWSNGARGGVQWTAKQTTKPDSHTEILFAKATASTSESKNPSLFSFSEVNCVA